jgi:hypothetical protein
MPVHTISCGTGKLQQLAFLCLSFVSFTQFLILKPASTTVCIPVSAFISLYIEPVSCMWRTRVDYRRGLSVGV